MFALVLGLFICTVTIAQLTRKAICLGTSVDKFKGFSYQLLTEYFFFSSVHKCMREWVRESIYPQYDWIMGMFYWLVLKCWSITDTSSRKHFIQTALLSCFTCFTTAKRTFICAPCKNEWQSCSPMNTAFQKCVHLFALCTSRFISIRLGCDVLFQGSLISILLTPRIQSVIVLFSHGLFPVTVCTPFSY